ncbi:MULTISPECIES: glycosyltransferase family 2 protein [Pseudomonas]|uniref:glycosyltransferase family 2 protein n=1 Tax=Pseudomonas TaxID=286 RepID=UPI000A1F29E8|nr:MULTISPECIES: glycosyltransferase [Pseudomonas]MCX4218930.1 glycosyltransferase [Pseudomonas sp. MCal1]UIN53195.1 glycosyltransferase [Pseudomonas kribbensis]
MSAINSTSKQLPAFSLVLVNYKTPEITRMCLEFLQQYVKEHQIPVWVVDNDSADESLVYLRSLDWINLIERPSPGKEAGHIAHGKALDLALAKVETDYLFLLHTDTFVFDSTVFSMMMNECMQSLDTAAVGCVEQLDRGVLRDTWRLSSRYFKHYFRRAKQHLGLPSRDPKPYRETHLKSFCTLWNARLIKAHGLHFSMDDRVPGYTLQDRLSSLGYGIKCLSPRTIFRYLDHIQAGTVAAIGGYGTQHRRTTMYQETLKRLQLQRGMRPAKS